MDLHDLAENGDVAGVQARLQAGADVSAVDMYGKTPLHCACIRGCVEVVRVLVGAGADVNAVDMYGDTSLHKASKRRDVEVVQVLVEAGADVNAVDRYGKTPLHCASERMDVEMVQVLVEGGADVNAVDKGGNTPLRSASNHGHVEVVQVLVEGGADVNVVDKSGNTALHIAGERSDVEMVQVLVKGGADVNAVAKGGNTALHSASARMDVTAVRVLVEAGADVNAVGTYGETPLHCASKRSDVEMVQVLVEAGADVNAVDKGGNTPLHCASKIMDVTVVQLLVEAGADVNAVDKGGNTALHIASERRDVEMMLVLVGGGADVNVVDKGGNTALHSASIHGHVEVVQVLVEGGADVNVVDKSGNTALQSASKSMDATAVQLLVEAGADVNVVDKGGNTPLHIAGERSDVEMMQVLVEGGADVNVVDKSGNSALHKASWECHRKVVQVLVRAGANVNAVDRYGDTPLHCASERREVGMMLVLVGGGADVNAVDKDGNTALHSASWQGHVEVVQVLVRAGADVNAVDKDGNTPLHSASWQGHVEVVQVLVEASADVNAVDKDGNTPLHTLMAAVETAPTVCRVIIAALKEAGADATLRNSAGLTADQVAERFSLDTKKALVPTVRVTTTVLFWALLGATLHYFDIVSDAQVAAAFWAEQNFVYFSLVMASAGMSSLYMLYILVGDCLRHESHTVMQRLSPLIGLLQLIPAVEVCRLVASWGGEAPDYDASTEDLRVVEVAVEAVPQLALQLYILGLLVEEGGVGSLGLLLVVSLTGSVGSMVYQYAGVTDRPQIGMTVPMWARFMFGVCRVCMLLGRVVFLVALGLATRTWGGVFVYLWVETWVVGMVMNWHTWSCRPAGIRKADVVCEGKGFQCCYQCTAMLCYMSPCCSCVHFMPPLNRTMLKNILAWSASLMVPFGGDPRELIDVPWMFVSETEVAWSQHPSLLHRIVGSVRGIMGVLILVALTIMVAVGEGSFDWVWPAACALGVWGMGTSGALLMSYIVLGEAHRWETTDPTLQSQLDAGQGASPSPTSSASPTAERGSKDKVHTMGASDKIRSGEQPSTIDENPLREVKVVGSPLATADGFE